MAAGCCTQCPTAPVQDARWRRVLWIALVVNAGFFVAEIVAGAVAGSAALQADALDFLGDAANYAISLGVTGMALSWRSRAAALKGGTMLALALWVLGNAAWHAYAGAMPQAGVMGAVGVAALAANGAVALMLWRHRKGDANRRSAWICSRNDAVGSAVVLLAAAGVFGTGTGWPDVAVAAVMGALGLQGGMSIVRQARAELRGEPQRPRHRYRRVKGQGWANTSTVTSMEGTGTPTASAATATRPPISAAPLRSASA